VLVRADGTDVPDAAPEMWEPMAPAENVVRVIRPEERTINTSELLAA
jgi:hypothetical protein